MVEKSRKNKFETAWYNYTKLERHSESAGSFRIIWNFYTKAAIRPVQTIVCSYMIYSFINSCKPTSQFKTIEIHIFRQKKLFSKFFNNLQSRKLPLCQSTSLYLFSNSYFSLLCQLFSIVLSCSSMRFCLVLSDTTYFLRHSW